MKLHYIYGYIGSARLSILIEDYHRMAVYAKCYFKPFLSLKLSFRALMGT